MLFICAGGSAASATAPRAPGWRAGDHPAVTLGLEVGYGGAVPPSGWTPVGVTVTARAGSFTGSVVVWTGQPPPSLALGPGIPAGSRIAQSLAQNPEPSVAERRPIALAAGATTRLTVYLLDSHQTVTAEVVSAAGRPVATAQSLPPVPVDGPQVAVVSSDPGALASLALVSLPGPGARIQVAHLTAATMPATGTALRAFNLIVLDDANTDKLTAAQRRALTDYVEAGGDLLVAGGSSGAVTMAGVPVSLRAMRPGGVQVLPGLPEVGSELGLAGASGPVTATVGVAGGPVDLAQGAVPILVERPVGDGQAFFSAIDLSAADQPGAWQAAIAKEVLLRALLPGTVPPGWALAPNPGFTANGAWLSQALAGLPSVPVASLWLVGFLVGLYVLLCGPGILWALRRHGRQEWAWVAIPLVALLGVAAVTGGSLALGGSPVVTERIQVVRLFHGSSRDLTETAVGVFSLSGGAETVHDTTFPGGALLAALAGMARTGLAPPSPVIEEGGTSGSGVRLTWRQPGDLAAFGGIAFGPAPGALDQALVRSATGIDGTITSHLSVALGGAVVVDGAAVARLGTIAPGQRVGVDLPSGQAPTAGGTLVGQLASDAIGCAGGCAQSGPLVQRQRGQRESVLYEALGANVDSVPPTLLAWVPGGSGALTVGGRHSDPSQQELVMMTLDPEATGPQLAPGEVVPHVVGLQGSVTPYVTAAGERIFGQLGPGASVTYEFDLPAGTAGTVAVTMRGASASPPGLELAVFDDASAAWDPLPLAGGQPSVLPPSAESAGGAVRVRVTNAAGTPENFQSLEISAS
ncbi:MAG TPA: hypothetical protein VKY26_06665 [Actinomycetota bacterium]|nr:hypothetical protein [Actinomycetota bacterium]